MKMDEDKLWEKVKYLLTEFPFHISALVGLLLGIICFMYIGNFVQTYQPVCTNWTFHSLHCEETQDGVSAVERYNLRISVEKAMKEIGTALGVRKVYLNTSCIEVYQCTERMLARRK